MTAARLDGHWLTLDNRRMAMIEDAEIRGYRPAFVMDGEGVRRYMPAALLAGIAILPAELGALPAQIAPASLAAAIAATATVDKVRP